MNIFGFKTWSRLHEDDSMPNDIVKPEIPKKSKQSVSQEEAVNHFRDVLTGVGKNGTFALSTHPDSNGNISPDLKLNNKVHVEIKGTRLRGKIDGPKKRPQTPDGIRISHRHHDVIEGSGGNSGLPDLRAFQLAGMLKKKQKLNSDGSIKYTGRLSNPSWEVYNHIRENHYNDLPVFQSSTHFYNHFNQPQNKKEYQNITNMWWNTGNKGRPMFIKSHAHVIATSHGQLIRTEKDPQLDLSDTLSEHGMGSVSENLNDYHPVGGFDAQYHANGTIRTMHTRRNISATTKQKDTRQENKDTQTKNKQAIQTEPEEQQPEELTPQQIIKGINSGAVQLIKQAGLI